MRRYGAAMGAAQVWTGFGALLILAGTAIALCVVAQEAQRHGVTSRWWQTVRTWWYRQILRRSVQTVETHAHFAAGVELRADASKVMTGNEPLDELGPWVVRRLGALREEIDWVRDVSGRATSEVRRQVAHVELTVDRQRITARERAATSVPLQAWSLMLIGAGTFVTLVPGWLGL